MNVRLNYLTEADLDRSIFRYYPLWFFERAVRLGNLDLIYVTKWADPFESTPWSVQVTDLENQQRQMSHSVMKPVYGQCWSQAKESDTLMRAYSRVVKDPIHRRNIWAREEGVAVWTTPRMILAALEATTQTYAKDHFMIGQVNYVSEKEYRQRVGQWVNKFRLSSSADLLWTGVDLLFWKREAFRHEEELRVVYVDPRGSGEAPVVAVSCDVKQLFKKVMFDPRLETFERKEREAQARDILGYQGEFVESSLYQRVLYNGLLPPS